jgi:hypothetical protein
LLSAQKLYLRSRLLELGLRLGVASAFPFEVGLELTLMLLTLAVFGEQASLFKPRLLELARSRVGLETMCLVLLLEPCDPRLGLAASGARKL